MCKCVQNCVGDCCKPAVAKPTAHRHAALMLQYAEDAATTDKPWELWQFKDITTRDWTNLGGYHPSWARHSEYRRKPRIILINGHEVAEPLRVAPPVGTDIFLTSNSVGSISLKWYSGTNTRDWLDKGLLHLTKEAAELHAKALLSFTQA